MSALEVRGLTKRFGGVLALDHVDVVVPAGSITAVVGPSGSGKTTLLRLVAGFERPDAGTVAVGDTIVAGAGRLVAPERRRVAIVPQEGALFPHLSVAANVGFGLPRGRGKGPRVIECLELVGLAGYDKRRPDQLSGGQQQRVALARALAPHPSLIMLDEPFSALDAALRPQVRAEVVAALRADGATAVIVTHDRDEALSMADQVVVLLDGRVAQAATPATLYRAPASAEVAAFIGPGEVVSGERRGSVVHTSRGELPVDVASRAPDGRVDVVVRPEPVLVYPPTDAVDRDPVDADDDGTDRRTAGASGVDAVAAVAEDEAPA
ncbi:MAG TPA: ABC transporter ATP-binding protein [Acidimicrobiales bacterium]